MPDELTETAVKVGDQIAFKAGYYGKYHLETVSKITPSGRIVCGRYTLNPDLTIRGNRGSFGPYRGQIVTDEILESVERDGLISLLSDRNWGKEPTDVMRKLRAILLSEANNGD